MAKDNIIVGLDVGTSKVRTIIASIKAKEDARPKIIGVGESTSAGMRKGVVVDIEEMTKSIKRSVDSAERVSGVSIDKVFVSVGGSHVKARGNKGVAAVSRADEEFSQEDVMRAIDNASILYLDPNREIIHIIPREFNIDGQGGIQDPRGMSGFKLEVDALIVEGLTPYIKNLRKCINNAGLEIQGLVLDVLAASQAVLTKKQKELGVLVLDFGAGTVGMAVYEEGKLLHINILPIGSAHITNDIAIGLRTSVETAEKIKLAYGSCLPEEVSKRDTIDLSKIDEKEEGVVARREISKIVEARMDEIFSLVNKELKKINRERLLPAGAVLIGGGAKTPDIIDLAKDKLKLPVQLGFPQGIDGLVEKIDEPIFATSIGLIFWALEMASDKEDKKMFSIGKVSPSGSKAIGRIKSWLRNFLP
jgi:cell division protein FtsA